MLVATTHSMAAPPDLTAGGTPDSTRTTNLGPTGMRGWVYHVNSGGISGNTSESRQILVTAARPAAHRTRNLTMRRTAPKKE